MTLAVIMTIIAVLLIAVGIVGIVYPILPGSLAVLTGILAWGLTLRGPEGWAVAIIGGLIMFAGMTAQAVLTGRTMKRHQIPNRSILFAIVGAVVGMFVIPIVGLFIGFAVGLYTSESVRQGDMRRAIPDTVAALKSMGLGILVELACALTAGSVFILGALTYFLTP
ncbi:DUF456 domain-containing protein [Rothia sp. ZJ932]|uniref:DUF456 domain-containing protein n=1 Tax=Rothia sp. ZJ932 TaxID=2810516 RepID=UPI0019676368|nr:DUF456 domain-containing protein [Rothia sp. ZJ932]QRZ61470.1 DUF456 domain-containing protein [Rothia sp. ZJ932]